MSPHNAETTLTIIGIIHHSPQLLLSAPRNPFKLNNNSGWNCGPVEVISGCITPIVFV